jgi:hypothetical protein
MSSRRSSRRRVLEHGRAANTVDESHYFFWIELRSACERERIRARDTDAVDGFWKRGGGEWRCCCC